MTLTLVIGTLDVIWQGWITARFPGMAVACVMAATLAAAIVGKLGGLALGHVRMSRALRSLELRLERS